MKKTFKFLAGLLLITLIFSCNRSAHFEAKFRAQSPAAANVHVFQTWNSLNEMNYTDSALPLSDEIFPSDFVPWAGIVSHHILAHEYIDAWFSRLAKMRTPKRFYILCPDHYKLSLEHYSLTEGSWDSGFGLVETDKNKVKSFIELLKVNTDDRVFEIEHGISVLMPYIKKHFPAACVVAVVISGESEVNTLIARQLADVLEKEFDKEGKQDNFLIISSDFSHKGSSEETGINDLKSEKYLRNSAETSWNSVNCDNKNGIYILDRLGKKNMESEILYHTNSLEISGKGEDDITSYFFVYFSDRKE